MGTTVFVVKNQQGLYLSKQQEWVDGADNHCLYRTRHRDEATNTVFEVSSRDIYLRAETVICELDSKGNPALATVEPLTAARAAQIARQQNADLEGQPAPHDEAASAEPEAQAEIDLDAAVATEPLADADPAAVADESAPT
jgi:hypothetical protein